MLLNVDRCFNYRSPSCKTTVILLSKWLTLLFICWLFEYDVWVQRCKWKIKFMNEEQKKRLKEQFVGYSDTLGWSWRLQGKLRFFVASFTYDPAFLKIWISKNVLRSLATNHHWVRYAGKGLNSRCLKRRIRCDLIAINGSNNDADLVSVRFHASSGLSAGRLAIKGFVFQK